MKPGRKVPSVLSVALVAVALLSIGWADSWQELKAGAGKVTSVSAEFTQEKHMQILSRPLVAGGIFYFQAPESLRWEYQYPVQSILLMHGGRTRRFVRTDGHFVADATAGLESMQLVVQEIARWLNGRFDENPAFAARLEPGRRIVLTPRKKSVGALIRRIELNLAKRPGILQSVVIYESQDSFTRIKFSHVRLNQPVPDSVFQKIK